MLQLLHYGYVNLASIKPQSGESGTCILFSHTKFSRYMGFFGSDFRFRILLPQ